MTKVFQTDVAQERGAHGQRRQVRAATGHCMTLRKPAQARDPGKKKARRDAWLPISVVAEGCLVQEPPVELTSHAACACGLVVRSRHRESRSTYAW